MAQYAQNPGEKQELLKLASPDNKEYFESQILAERQSIVTVLEVRLCNRSIVACKVVKFNVYSLQNFPSVSLPLEVFLDVAERAKPRYYSISSSPKVLSVPRNCACISIHFLFS
jgi:sulfite reductase alpha subunit-like flavoprotein